jgi:hypothetical protein
MWIVQFTLLFLFRKISDLGPEYSGTDSWLTASPGLLALRNPDDSTNGLMFDLHRKL